MNTSQGQDLAVAQQAVEEIIASFERELSELERELEKKEQSNNS